MLRPRAGGRGGGEARDPAGSARRRPRSRLPHVSLRLGPPSLHLGGLSPQAPRDEAEAPAPPQRSLTTEQLPSPGRWQPPPCPPSRRLRLSGGSSGSARSSARCLPRSVRGSRLTPERGAGGERRLPMTQGRGSGDRRAGGCASGRGTRSRRRRCRLYGRVRTEERKGRSRVEPKLPLDLTPDPRAAWRACSVAVSFGAGGDCSFGRKEEAQAAPSDSCAHHPKMRHLAPDPRKAGLIEEFPHSLTRCTCSRERAPQPSRGVG
ncbi:serine/arginine-rich splicing factor 12-like [Theropithecus gelada]|uniref:serine/arginine-rich splicing factor 12-like n=1 Tax=Theropithecus gelada TaxID=9565 RepID=UPI000DC17BCC|nr:serine/arginine-rich splicing factor 12-like [Theropithecus gelada]